MKKKPSGEIGNTHISAIDGVVNATIDSTILPQCKEELEEYFAVRFVPLFNEIHPLGDNVEIEILWQNGTDKLDFSISCQCADYLEVAELTPLSEDFGKEAKETGKINTYQYSKWIWQNIILDKQDRYKKLGRDSSRTILLLYVTHWEFMPYPNLIECLRSTLQNSISEFNSVFLMFGNGKDMNKVEILQPYFGRTRQPRKFRDIYNQITPPGTNLLYRSDEAVFSVIPVDSDGSTVAQGSISIFNMALETTEIS